MNQRDLSRLDGERARRLSRQDAILLCVLALLAAMAILSGAAVRSRLSPTVAEAVNQSVAAMQPPLRLGDARLIDEHGGMTTLESERKDRPFVVSLVGPGRLGGVLQWLDERLSADDVYLIVVPKGAEVEATRRALDDLGFEDVPFFIDTGGTVVTSGKARTLPTTFVVGEDGVILARVEGTRRVELERLYLRYTITAREAP